MTKKINTFSDDDQAQRPGEDDGVECTVCHQEFRGACPLSNVDCPCLDDLDDDEEEDVEEEEEEEEAEDDAG